MKKTSTDEKSEPKFILWGSPGAGKTVAACSASKFFPAQEELGKKEVSLDDVIFVKIEDGLASLEGLKLRVPTVLDLTGDLVTDDGVPSVPKLERGLKEAYKYIREHGTSESVIVIDSLSRMDSFAMSYFEQQYGNVKYKPYQYSLSFHLNQCMAISQLPGTVVLIAHGKVAAPIDNEDTRRHKEAKARASGLSEVHRPAAMSLTGAAEQHYIREFGEIYFMEARSKRKAGKTTLERYFYPMGNEVGGGKTRYLGLLDAEEPANLQHIMKKIRGGTP